ncbi:MAG TPA: S1/P1 nuclease [Stellaceae bacterium]|nr:S1/P1 nuclease [Stellaceae bacterium]
MRSIVATAVLCGIALTAPQQARAWGDEAHEIVALLADHYLDPAVHDQVGAMLAADTDKLTKHDIASEATWADHYRDSDFKTTKKRYNQTYWWHLVYTGQPCTGRSDAPHGMNASTGPAKDCVVTKINQFAAELAEPSTTPKERLLALKFLLNLVADVNDPLSDSDNQGAATMKVTADGFKPATLMHFWEVDLVARIGTDAQAVADQWIPAITDADARAWQAGTPENWTQQGYELAREHAYGKLPPPDAKGVYHLDAAYVDDAGGVVALQLHKAGLRLAKILNKALAKSS